MIFEYVIHKYLKTEKLSEEEFNELAHMFRTNESKFIKLFEEVFTEFEIIPKDDTIEVEKDLKKAENADDLLAKILANENEFVFS